MQLCVYWEFKSPDISDLLNQVMFGEISVKLHRLTLIYTLNTAVKVKIQHAYIINKNVNPSNDG